MHKFSKDFLHLHFLFILFDKRKLATENVHKILVKLITDLFNVEYLAKLKQYVEQEVNSQGLEMLPKTVQDFYNLDFSYFYTSSDNLLIILHVPVVNTKQIIALYQANPSPTPIPKYHALYNKDERGYIIPMLSQTMIAIAGNNSHKTIFNSKEIGNCYGYFDHYYCPKFSLLDNDLGKSCLGSIFFGHKDVVWDHCIVGSGPFNKEYHFQVSETEHIVSVPKYTETQLHCGNRQKPQILELNNTIKVHIPKGCGIKMKNESFYSPWNFNGNPMIVAKVPINLDNYINSKLNDDDHWMSFIDLYLIEIFFYFIGKVFVTTTVIITTAIVAHRLGWIDLWIPIAELLILADRAGLINLQQMLEDDADDAEEFSRLRCYG